ncbi:MAG: EAL domain-containing protein [Eubacteriales bacterium]
MGNVIKLAHDINLKVIAEGIETKEQFDFLKSQGCDWGQGYWLNKPLDHSSMTDYIRSKIKLDKK